VRVPDEVGALTPDVLDDREERPALLVVDDVALAGAVYASS